MNCPIFSRIGRALQRVRCDLKTLILLVSFGTFVWLVVSTTNRPEFTRPGSRFQTEGETDPKTRWSESSVEIFLSLLDMDSNVTALAIRSESDPCPLVDEVIFTAFFDDSMEEYLWQYYTLLALQQASVIEPNNKFNVRAFLPLSTKRRLEELFAEVQMEIISELSFDCYDIANAVILTSSSEIPLPKRRDQIYILDTGTRRYQDLVGTVWSEEHDALKPAEADAAKEYLLTLRKKVPIDGVEFVGIYIQENDRLPFDYYYRAIAFQRKLHSARLIFVVVCAAPQGSICSKIIEPKQEIFLLKTTDPAYDFAVLSLCNHTIVSNQVGIFHALNSGGDVVVYEFDDTLKSARYLPWLIANEMSYWYQIG